MSPKVVRRTFALLVFLISFGIRLIGIDWGLPTDFRHQSLHPDELLIKEFSDKTPYFRPGFYNYGTFYLTILKVASDMGRTYGFVPEGKNVPQWVTDRAIHKTGRIISALSGSICTSLLFLMALSISGYFAAWIAASLSLIAPAFLVHSRFQTTDVFATAIILTSAYLLMLFFNEPESRKWLFLSAFFCGLAAGTKYTGILFFAPIMVSVIKFKGLDTKCLLISISCLFLGILIATPGILLETSAFWNGFNYELNHTAEGHGIVFANTPSGFTYHLGNLIDSLGLMPFFVAIAGIILSVKSRHPFLLSLLLFCLIYYVLIGRAEVKFVRYVFPLVPFFILMAAFILHKLSCGKTVSKICSTALLMLIAFGIRAQIGPVTLTELMTIQDPRDRCALWLKERFPHSTIGFVTTPWFYSPSVFPDTGIFGEPNRLMAMRAASNNLLRTDGPEWDSKLITDLAPEFIIISSFEFIDNDRIAQPDFVTFMSELPKKYTLRAVFWGPTDKIRDEVDLTEQTGRLDLRTIFWDRYTIRHDLMYIQPTICVFQRRS